MIKDNKNNIESNATLAASSSSAIARLESGLMKTFQFGKSGNNVEVSGVQDAIDFEDPDDKNCLVNCGFIVTLLLSTLGWFPQMSEDTKQSDMCKFPVLFISFVLNLGAAIFHVILAGKIVCTRSPDEVGLGIFLLIMIFYGRMILGFYGYSGLRTNGKLARTTVYLVEDGAAILISWVNSKREMDWLKTTIMWLTITIRGIPMIHLWFLLGGFVFFTEVCGFIRTERDRFEQVLLIAGYFAFPIFLFCLFIIGMVRKDDDEPLSGGLKIAQFVVYGVGTLSVSIICWSELLWEKKFNGSASEEI